MSGFSAGLIHRSTIERVPLATRTTFGIGGAAELVQLHDRRDLVELRDAGARLLGGGANLLVGDEGVAEPVMRLGRVFAELGIAGTRVTVGAGCALSSVVAAAARAGLSGLEDLAAIPGTVGGALIMNAGAHGTWIMDRVERLEILLPFEASPRWLERAEVTAGYRDGGLPSGSVVLGCVLNLTSADAAVVTRRMERVRADKQTRQPVGAHSAGCVFRNPSPAQPAGRLIDELGFKGHCVGGAEVARRHANFIVNVGGARAVDVCRLIAAIRHRAWYERGVVLELEVETWNCPSWLYVHPGELEECHAMHES
jgi:UDP-N-acetylmuramate dehydrogenase